MPQDIKLEQLVKIKSNKLGDFSELKLTLEDGQYHVTRRTIYLGDRPLFVTHKDQAEEDFERVKNAIEKGEYNLTFKPNSFSLESIELIHDTEEVKRILQNHVSTFFGKSYTEVPVQKIHDKKSSMQFTPWLRMKEGFHFDIHKKDTPILDFGTTGADKEHRRYFVILTTKQKVTDETHTRVHDNKEAFHDSKFGFGSGWYSGIGRMVNPKKNSLALGTDIPVYASPKEVADSLRDLAGCLVRAFPKK